MKPTGKVAVTRRTYTKAEVKRLWNLAKWQRRLAVHYECPSAHPLFTIEARTAR